jgi:DUF4097 and DUF4098 domain-containing protein YvlB
VKEEIKRIMALVQQGKLSPEDAADLIEAFSDSEDENGGATGTGSSGGTATETKEEKKVKDPFASFVDAVERLGRDVSRSVDWQDVATQLRGGVQKGVDAARKAAKEAQKSGSPFGIFGASEESTVELPLHVPEGKTLRIEANSGNVKVRGGHEVGSLTSKATFRAVSQDDAKERARHYTPLIEEGDQQVILKQPEGHDFSANLEVKVPTGTNVEVRLSSGDVSIRETEGSVRVQNKTGDIVVKNAKGAVDVLLTSGDVLVEDSETPMLTVETKTGDLTAQRIQGPMNLRTSTGDIRVEESTGRTLSAESALGDVYLNARNPITGSVNVRTVTGDVSLAIPDGSDASVTLSTLRGEIHCDVDLEDDTQDTQRVSGRLGNGEGHIDVSAVNGDVHLRWLDSSA